MKITMSKCGEVCILSVNGESMFFDTVADMMAVAKILMLGATK